MASFGDDQYEPGHQPYDRMNAARVGALVGITLGAIVTAISGVSVIWFIAGGAVLGAGVGWVVAPMFDR